MNSLQIQCQPLPGVFILSLPHSSDHRGEFLKLYHDSSLSEQGIRFAPAESFLTRSKAGVIRGMHYQAGRAAHEKLVYCIKGRVLDVVVDIRHNSPHYNKPFSIELSEDKRNCIFISKGYAHGFLALADDNWMLYKTSTVHCAQLDKGVLWSSIDFNWPVKTPALSERDLRHPSIGDVTCEFS